MTPITFNYTATADECGKAFLVFWKSYRLRQTVLYTITFAIAVFLFVNMAVTSFRNTGTLGIIGPVGVGLVLGFIVNLWLKPRRAAKKIVAAVEMSDSETYTAQLSDTAVTIETVVHSADNADGDNNADNSGDAQQEKIEKSVYELSCEELRSCETNDLFILFVNRALFHVFPKRCLDDNQTAQIREYFANKDI